MPLDTVSADERAAPDPTTRARACDCPCHRGDDIFHIVSCCGSVLGRRRPRESIVHAASQVPPALPRGLR